MSSNMEQNEETPQHQVEPSEEAPQEQEEQEPLNDEEDVRDDKAETQGPGDISEEQGQQLHEQDTSYEEPTDAATEAYDEEAANPLIDTRVTVHSADHVSNTQGDHSIATREGVQESVRDSKTQMSATLPPSGGHFSPLPATAVNVADTSTVREATTVRKTHPPRSEPFRPSSSSMRRRVSPSGTLTPLYTSNYMTTREEHMAFRARNGLSPNYIGPVHVVENVYVTCAECCAPVDPVTRVPAGKLFFHPQCIRCKLCGLSSLTEAYFQAMYNAAICSECATRGFAPCVAREAAAARGIITGAVRGTLASAIRRFDRQHHLRSINHPTVEGVVPPTLSVPPLYTRRNSTRGSMALIRRQQYYTQNDNNILCLPPTAPIVELPVVSRPATSSPKRTSQQRFPKLM